MIEIQPYIKTAKLIAIAFLIVASVWFYKDYQYQKSENQRQTENASQLRKSDSLRFTSQILTTNEIKDYLEYSNKELKKKLENDKIKPNRIESIISSNYHYRDTIKRETDITSLVNAIKNSVPKSQKWQDTTKCQTIKGTVDFDGSKLKVTVDDREFNNKSDAVAYWERRQWKFLGIKTRFLGKIQMTSKIYDECGETRIMKIEKKK